MYIYHRLILPLRLPLRLQAPREAHVQYSSDLSLLDPVLVREMCNVLTAYPAALDQRWAPLKQKKRPTPADLKVRSSLVYTYL